MANSVLGHVIPAKAGIQGIPNTSYVYVEGLYDGLLGQLDSSFRWNDTLFHINMAKESFIEFADSITSEGNGPQVLADFTAQIDADKKSIELREAQCNSNRNLRISH